VAEPFTGIPWMEAILGCEIRAGDASFVSRHWMASLDELDRVRLDPQNPWFLKYLEFTEKLVRLSAGRFPVGMPIMRGPSDIVGAIMGQTEMVFALADESERMKEFFNRAAEAFLGVLTAQNALIPPSREAPPWVSTTSGAPARACGTRRTSRPSCPPPCTGSSWPNRSGASAWARTTPPYTSTRPRSSCWTSCWPRTI
jgi:hypothetical protein